MFGHHLNLRDDMSEILSHLFRIPVDGKPITILDIPAVPSEVLNVVVSLVCRLTFDYEIEEAGVVRNAVEVHELGLFTTDETLKAFAAAGLQARHEAPSSRNRGLYIARATD